jgi:hypothetical protein
VETQRSRECTRDVSLRKILTLEEQWSDELLRKPVCKAIAEVQASRMPAATEATECGAGKLELRCVERDDIDVFARTAASMYQDAVPARGVISQG